MTVRVAIVGCGAVARRSHLPAFRLIDEVEVVAFVSRSVSSAQAARDQWGGGRVHSDWREVVEALDVDLVDIATPNMQHAPVAVAAADAGKHVLVEKPMACSLADADAMIAAAEQSGVLLVPAQSMRGHPNYRTMRDLVVAGRIGAVTGARVAWGHAGPEEWEPSADWFFRREQAGGGALLDLGVHAVDLLRWFLDDDVQEVTAMVSGVRGDVEESAQAVLRFAGGALASVHATWAARPGPDHQVTLLGTEGTLHADAFTLPVLFRVGGRPERLDVPAGSGEFFSDVVRAVTGVGEPPVSARDGREALAAVLAGYESATTGQVAQVRTA